MQRYLNTRTLVAAVLVVVVVVAVFPDAIRYLPYLVLLACPFMMFFMHGHGGHSGHQAKTGSVFGDYTCPMHSEIRSTFPGECPRCGMDLKAIARASSGRGETGARRT